MLMGKAYYFRNDADSAYLTFQYINYAFSPKEKDGYDIPIGSNASEESNVFTVSTPEKNSLAKRAFSTPPSRNEAFIWQIRTYIINNKPSEAAALIETLKNDPRFPQRLNTDLEEVQALWFYHKKMYDSAAIHLEKALGNADDRRETSRWEYLIAQLYDRAGKSDSARQFYERAGKHTLDPVLEVYSILNSIRQKSSDSASIKKNIEVLQKMGRRDLYSKYRDIIYYTAAQIELERKNISGAKAMLLKSVGAPGSNMNPSQRTKSFLLLGELSFREKNYYDARRFYDSLNNNDPGITDPYAFGRKKEMLQHIVMKSDIISRQDSLQKIAAMPEAERTALLKKMAKQLRKKQGLREEEQTGNTAVGLNKNNEKNITELFPSNDKGDWYFNNPSLKSKGYTSFKQTWGNRPNIDNWRRQSDVSQNNIAARENSEDTDAQNAITSDSAGPVSYTGLLKNLPLTPRQLEISEDSIQNAMLDLAVIYVDNLEDYPTAIITLEKFKEKYSYSNRMPEALYYLFVAYKKTGNQTAASAIQKELDQKYSGTGFQQRVRNVMTGEGDAEKKKATQDYENIYSLFIEGNFKKALELKKISDSLYGTAHWTPQLLYIESVYYIRTKQDAEAKKVLQRIIELYPENEIAEKSATMLEVLGRRKEIEDYLTKLDIKRTEDTVFIANKPAKPRERIGTPMKQDSTTLRPIPQRKLITDSVAKKPISAPGITIKKDSVTKMPAGGFSFTPESAHDVVILLNKVDPVYVTESRNAFNRYNKEKYYNRTIDIQNVSLNDTLKLVVMSGFENAATALDYLDKTRAAAGRIIPWLPAARYSFLIISAANLELLKNNKDIKGYRKFEERYFLKK